jgi:hypothetical protein
MSELPPTWRYNVKELRMEKSVPPYGEDEEYVGHMWAALVPEDIREYCTAEREREGRQVAEAIMSVADWESPEHAPDISWLTLVREDFDRVLEACYGNGHAQNGSPE